MFWGWRWFALSFVCTLNFVFSCSFACLLSSCFCTFFLFYFILVFWCLLISFACFRVLVRNVDVFLNLLHQCLMCCYSRCVVYSVNFPDLFMHTLQKLANAKFGVQFMLPCISQFVVEVRGAMSNIRCMVFFMFNILSASNFWIERNNIQVCNIFTS